MPITKETVVRATSKAHKALRDLKAAMLKDLKADTYRVLKVDIRVLKAAQDILQAAATIDKTVVPKVLASFTVTGRPQKPLTLTS